MEIFMMGNGKMINKKEKVILEGKKLSFIFI
jgi:hypothetical protein